MANSYQDLRVWQKSLAFAKLIYEATKTFPKEELYGLVSQMRRCAVSIPSNIAEGCARNTQGEFTQFIGIAKGSTAELHTQILLSKELGLITSEKCKELEAEIDDIGKMLSGLKSSIK